MGRRTTSWQGVRIHTIGHSTRTLDELLGLLRGAGVAILADIRTIPRSRRNPQFDGASLAATLGARGLRYAHLARLGGLRRARKDSPNTAWRNASFRGFADYMGTPDFEAGLAELHALAAQGSVALMCAEAVPWRCHRSLVADALTARGAEVLHVTGGSRAHPHRVTPFAKIDGTRVTYPGEDADGGILATRAPFHLEATVRVLQRRPANRVEVWEGGRYRRVLAGADGPALVEVENRGSIDVPDVHFSIAHGSRSAAGKARLAETARRVLGLDVDPAPLQRLAASEPGLRPAASALRGMRPPRFAGLFETFANVVPFQQVSLDAGVSITGRLAERFGERLEHEGRRWLVFPTPQAVGSARLGSLRACGLSARKAESLRAIARAIDAGELSEEKIAGLPTSDALAALTELPGIGPWSASLVLLRGFGRLDVFPPGDVGAGRGLGGLLGLRSKASLGRVVERSGDRRGYLYFCALGASLLARGLIRAAPGSAGERPGVP